MEAEVRVARTEGAGRPANRLREDVKSDVTSAPRRVEPVRQWFRHASVTTPDVQHPVVGLQAADVLEDLQKLHAYGIVVAGTNSRLVEQPNRRRERTASPADDFPPFPHRRRPDAPPAKGKWFCFSFFRFSFGLFAHQSDKIFAFPSRRWIEMVGYVKRPGEEEVVMGDVGQ